MERTYTFPGLKSKLSATLALDAVRCTNAMLFQCRRSVLAFLSYIRTLQRHMLCQFKSFTWLQKKINRGHRCSKSIDCKSMESFSRFNNKTRLNAVLNFGSISVTEYCNIRYILLFCTIKQYTIDRNVIETSILWVVYNNIIS